MLMIGLGTGTAYLNIEVGYVRAQPKQAILRTELYLSWMSAHVRWQKRARNSDELGPTLNHEHMNPYCQRYT